MDPLPTHLSSASHKGIPTTDTFKEPMLLTSKSHFEMEPLQTGRSCLMTEYVEVLMSVRALAQAEVLTSQRKETTIVMTKSCGRRKGKEILSGEDGLQKQADTRELARG